MKDSEWYERRKKGIGGSDAAAVLGVSPFKSPLRLWMEKRGEVEPDNLDENQAVFWGTKLESYVADHYEHITGRTVTEAKHLSVHREFPWMICNVDRFVKELKLILEIKCTGFFAFRNSDWGADGSDKVPAYYYAQAQHNCCVTNAVQCDMPVLIGGNDYRCYHLPANKEFQAKLIEIEQKFMDSLATGVRPEPICDADLKLLFPRETKGLHKEADAEIGPHWAALCKLKPKLTKLNAEKKQLEFLIKKEMGEAEILSCDGTVLATWRSSENGRRTFRLKGVDGIEIDE